MANICYALLRERPILFSGPMVRALLAGTKTQTRRVVKPQPEVAKDSDYVRCPYGAPGDRLWVREAWSWYADIHQGSYAYVPPAQPTYPPHFVAPDGGRRAVVHRAGKENYAWGLSGEPKWKPGIHMPRTACRLMLQVTDVRIERLQAITESDAIAEGVEKNCDGLAAHPECPPCKAAGQCQAEGEYLDYGEGEDGFPAANARDSYRSLWDSINGQRGLVTWTDNPWVWVVTFRRLDGHL